MDKVVADHPMEAEANPNIEESKLDTKALNDIIVGKGVANAIKYFGSRNMLGVSDSFFTAFKANDRGRANEVVIGR